MVKSYIKSVVDRVNESLLYGNMRQLNINKLEFKENILKSDEYKPVFVLSTGRTGTEFFTQLISKSKKYKVFHSPSALLCNAESELIEQGKIVYEQYKQDDINIKLINILASQIFMASREELLYKTFLHNKSYLETNNRITFLAPALKYLFPNAKFIHLYRHPGEFIRSGIRRNYYNSNNIHESGRLIPVTESPYYNKWKNFDNIEKIAWLWNETNDFIDTFLDTLDKNDYFKFNFNELNLDNINLLLEFLEIDDIKEKFIKDSIMKPTNIQKKGSFPKYRNWERRDKEKVINICSELALKYKYKL